MRWEPVIGNVSRLLRSCARFRTVGTIPQDLSVNRRGVYVLRSKSDHPTVAANRELVHKIGVTNMNVAQRIAEARLQPTFLMADVEIVATYELFNIKQTKLERLIHRVLGPAQLDNKIPDRLGNLVEPREWFLVPVFVIHELVDRIKDGTITNYIYDPAKARLKIAKG